VGDINRMVSQEKRGGGTIAFQDGTLWAALSKTDLLVAPPGHTRVDARALIQATHKVIHERLPTAAAKPGVKKKAARKPAKKTTARKHASTRKKAKRR
jgi:Deoxyribonuclease II